MNNFIVSWRDKIDGCWRSIDYQAYHFAHSCAKEMAKTSAIDGFVVIGMPLLSADHTPIAPYYRVIETINAENNK